MRALPLSVVLATIVGLLPLRAEAQLQRSATGATLGDIVGTVDQFRADLGGSLNPNVSGSFSSGRREINWDGVPDAFSEPNNLPADFFNVNSPRGVVFSTPGTGLQVSARAASNTPIQFGYSELFATFTPERLFTAVDSNTVDVNFFVPGSNIPAFVRGFGAVFTDVDLANTSSISFFGASNTPLGSFLVPAFAGNETLSFLGVSFADAIISRVRITSGNAALGAGVTEAGGRDLVVMDDFIYGEPVAVPGPIAGAGLPALLGLAGAWFVRRRKQKLAAVAG